MKYICVTKYLHCFTINKYKRSFFKSFFKSVYLFFDSEPRQI